MRSTAVAVALLSLALPAASQDDEVPVPEALVREGIPRIPTSLAEGVGRYSDFRQAFFSSWHPRRREMLIVTRFGDTYQAHQVQFPGGARTQLTFYPDNVFNDVLYDSAAGDSFIFGKDVGGNEFYQYYRGDLTTGDITLLTDGKSRNTGAVWSHAGKRLAYGSTRRTGKDVDIYIVDPSEPKTDHLVGKFQGGGWQVVDWSPDDQKLLVVEGVSANESYLWSVDASTGAATLLTPKGGPEKVAYGNARFSVDGKGLYVTTDQDSEFQRLAYVDLATRKHTFLTDHIHWDVDEFDLSPDGHTIAFVTNEEGPSVLHLLDTGSGREKPGPKVPVGLISGVRWQPNGKELGFSFETSRSTSDAYSLDIASGKLERWTRSETGGINTQTFPEPELVHWTSFDGRPISGFLYRPPTRFEGKRPVVIEIHGGPEGQSRPGFLGRPSYLLNELGVALLFPNVRGSTGYGKTFLKLDNGFLREGAYNDIGALLDWIKDRPDLDAERVMVTGGSYGGYMTLAVATLYNDRIRCSVDVVGPSNLVTFLENTSGYRQDLRRVEYGDERDPKMRAFLERIAPANNADKIKKPLLVVQGQNDPRVPRTESEQMVAALRRNGTPVWYLMAKDEGHGFSKKKNVDYQLYATVLFMKQFLLK
jgi:dipeptidyl aminopeptidase/acylaminoacyl peptidase